MNFNYIFQLLKNFILVILCPVYISFLLNSLIFNYSSLSYFWFFFLCIRLLILILIYILILYNLVIKIYWQYSKLDLLLENFFSKYFTIFYRIRNLNETILSDLLILEKNLYPDFIKERKSFLEKIKLCLRIIICIIGIINFFFYKDLYGFLSFFIYIYILIMLYFLYIDWYYKISILNNYGFFDALANFFGYGFGSDTPFAKSKVPPIVIDKGPLSVPVESKDLPLLQKKFLTNNDLIRMGITDPVTIRRISRTLFYANAGIVGIGALTVGCWFQGEWFGGETYCKQIGGAIKQNLGLHKNIDSENLLEVQNALNESKANYTDLKAQFDKLKDDIDKRRIDE